MGQYLTAAIQAKHDDSWETFATFYFWKDYQLQVRIATLYDALNDLAKKGKLVKDRYWPEESESASCYLVPGSELTLLDQDDEGPVSNELFKALKETVKVLTSDVRVCFWIK